MISSYQTHASVCSILSSIAKITKLNASGIIDLICIVLLFCDTVLNAQKFSPLELLNLILQINIYSQKIITFLKLKGRIIDEISWD